MQKEGLRFSNDWGAIPIPTPALPLKGREFRPLARWCFSPSPSRGGSGWGWGTGLSAMKFSQINHLRTYAKVFWLGALAQTVHLYGKQKQQRQGAFA